MLTYLIFYAYITIFTISSLMASVAALATDEEKTPRLPSFLLLFT